MVMPPTLVTSPIEEAAEQLQSRILGKVLLPGQPGYDDARKAWNLTVEQRPAAILIATSPWDVVEAMHFARETNLGIAVQSTGHGIARPADGALLIITSELTYVQIDTETQTAWVEAGALWHMVLEKAQHVGLAPLLGSSSHVGVMGYTLGGGIGWLARKYGLAADSVRYFEVVTADGQRRRVSQTENSELFWGLRGGGGSFGVITGMEIQLYPVTTVYGGNLFYPVEAATSAFQYFREWIADAPDELTSSISIMNMPSLPQLPQFMRGKTVIVVRAVYTGAVEEGEAWVQKWLDWMPPMANTFRPMPFSEIDSVSNDPKDPTYGHSSGAWLGNLSDEAIDVIVARGVSMNGSSPLVMTEVRHAGGAIARTSPNATAYSSRDANLLLHMVAMTPTTEALEYARQYLDQFQMELAPHLTGSVYINFLEGKEARERTRDAYRPQAYHRLKLLKAEYDPDNRFRYSFDIPPMKAD